MKLPEIDTFILETPLYEKFGYSLNDEKKLFDLIYFDEKIDCYCTSCNKERTFKGIEKKPFDYDQYLGFNPSQKFISTLINHFHIINLVCTRNEEHLMQLSVYISPNYILKVGQYPSLADISKPDLRKYRTILNNDKYNEFIRGIGLFSHGIGIGAFVYLRRVFEHLIEEAHKKLSKRKDWNEITYKNSRMVDMIKLLQTELPIFLVKNRKLYSILSIGIHDLSEDECIKYFPIVQLGIESILDEKLEAKSKQDKKVIANKSINKIHESLSSGQ